MMCEEARFLGPRNRRRRLRAARCACATDCTVCTKTGDVLVLSLLLPLYTAVMLCLPSASLDVANEACPVASSATVASFLVPSMNAAFPDGIPPPGAFAVTVAVNVTEWPLTDGFLEEVSAVALLSFVTVWVSAGEVLAPSFPLPL